jgi:hypothetical protein
MTKKIKVTSPFFGFVQKREVEQEKLRVRVIRAPLVNQDDLRNVVFSRARAIVL